MSVRDIPAFHLSIYSRPYTGPWTQSSTSKFWTIWNEIEGMLVEFGYTDEIRTALQAGVECGVGTGRRARGGREKNSGREVSECVSGWVGGWVGEWVSEWVSEWGSDEWVGKWEWRKEGGREV